MRIVRIVKRRVHSFLRRSNADAELQCEIEIHIQQLTSEAMASGMVEPRLAPWRCANLAP